MIAVSTLLLLILVFAGVLYAVYRETEIDFPCKKSRRQPGLRGDQATAQSDQQKVQSNPNYSADQHWGGRR